MKIVHFRDIAEEETVNDIIEIKIKRIINPDGKPSRYFIVHVFHNGSWETIVPLTEKYKLVVTNSVLEYLNLDKNIEEIEYSKGLIRVHTKRTHKPSPKIDDIYLRSYIRELLGSNIVSVTLSESYSIQNSYNGKYHLGIGISSKVTITTSNNENKVYYTTSLLTDNFKHIKHSSSKLEQGANVIQSLQSEYVIDKLKNINILNIVPLLIDLIGRRITNRILKVNDGNMNLLNFIILSHLLVDDVAKRFDLDLKFQTLYRTLKII